MTGGLGDYPSLIADALTDRMRSDVAEALKAGKKDRVGALRLVLSELQKAAKEGRDDAEAVAESGAFSPGDTGRVMGAVMAKVSGRADGRRVSGKVKEALAG